MYRRMTGILRIFGSFICLAAVVLAILDTLSGEECREEEILEEAEE